ncbi:DUF4268 domain-containing protein [Pseudoalteromonas peptidolytica]|uniref:DUF4268 domain-containing protein n=1 Tax=Pseudoalteromonas peptidolytica TaxID=61150 RepID=UPI00298DE52C|nr:DUF4268 domain-containing protein [Pseudoalteromonas peptidolytica]MDW7548611.1 DUF4268 domain-containing protein [Pseudoalteromonas peptidolytica]
MFKIDQSSNRITRLESKRFSELGFSERNHLQEWLANQPDAFGEELLIIQKEFDGFDDTRERLDLLALDKDGNLVIIENKLDDTGRDVVWQALKYASYCSSLNKKQIVEIYQGYLNRFCQGGDANQGICEFLEVPDLGEVVLNSGNAQRLIFVAANYRKEVTSTALWLLSHGIQVQCFKVTPYSMQFGSLENVTDELFLNVEQIIPTPEAKELMISMSAKESDEKKTEQELKSRHTLRLAFWEQALEAMRDSSCDLYNNINPTKDHWLCAGSGVTGCPYSMIFGAKEIRVEIWLGRSSKDDNKFMFDWLFEKKEQIEETFGQEIEWLRLNDKKSSRIQLSKAVNGKDEANWSEYIQWLVTHISKLESSLKPLLPELNSEVRGRAL